MAAPKNNTFWRKRDRSGRNKIFETPQELEEMAYEYFTWCIDNPIMKSELIKSGDLAGKIIQVPIPRPFTNIGICNFLDISEHTLNRYCSEVGYEDFWQSAKKLKDIVYQQKMEGGVTGLYNASLVQRVLGIKDQSEVTQTTITDVKVGFE